MTWAAGRPADAEAPSNEKPKEPPEPESPRHRVTSSSSSAITAHWSSPLCCHLPRVTFSLFLTIPALLHTIKRIKSKGRTTFIWVISSPSSALLSPNDGVSYPSGTHTHARDEEAPSPLPRAALRNDRWLRSVSLALIRLCRKERGHNKRCFKIHAAHAYATPLPRYEVIRRDIDAEFCGRAQHTWVASQIDEALAGKYNSKNGSLTRANRLTPHDWLNERAAPPVRAAGPSPHNRCFLPPKSRSPIAWRGRSEVRSVSRMWTRGYSLFS